MSFLLQRPPARCYVTGRLSDFFFIFLIGNAAVDVFVSEEGQVIDVMPLENGIWDISSSLKAIVRASVFVKGSHAIIFSRHFSWGFTKK